MTTIPTLTRAAAATLLLGLAGMVHAFTLTSPPLQTPPGGAFQCAIYNHSSSKTMQAAIHIVDDQGNEVPEATTQFCNGGLAVFCVRSFKNDADSFAPAMACRIEVSGVGKSDARAAVELFDSTFRPLVTLEAR